MEFGGCDTPTQTQQQACYGLGDAVWFGQWNEHCETPGIGVCWDIYFDVCAGYADAGSCSSWSPASEITLTGGVYEVDSAWFASVIANPAPLWTCDDAYFDPQSVGFKLKAASNGEMLYELGLRTQDIPLTLNGMELDNYSEAIAAFAALYQQGETDYTLVVDQSGTPTTFAYELVP